MLSTVTVLILQVGKLGLGEVQALSPDHRLESRRAGFEHRRPGRLNHYFLLDWFSISAVV